ncbi:MAG: hypothetical protein N3D11_10030 [Candidatus Sumerlaeia bacterium]|nr:hypothetical protein [Candidatus Sumerlaeia bacterium]
MKRLLTCSILFLALNLEARAAENATTETRELASLEELHTFLFTNKSQVALGEPVYLKLVFANWSQTSRFEIQGFLHPANDLEIQVARVGELPARYTGGFKKDALIPGLTVHVRPRQVAALRWTLCWDPDHDTGFLFEQPGKYVLTCRARMTINQTPRDLVFDRMELEVLPPTAEQKNALALVFTPECAEALHKLQIRPEALKTWQEAAERFPKTVWGPYAKMLVARHALDSGSRDFMPVAKQIEALISDYPDFPLREDAYYLMASCQDRMGRPIEALQWLYRLQREYPASAYIQEGMRLFRKYIYSDGWEERYSPWFLRE